MNVALVLSGGTGKRIGGDIPKQYMKINDMPIITYSLKTLFEHEMVDAVHIVASQEYRSLIEKEIEKLVTPGTEDMFRGFSEPGETRQLSILNGLRDIRKYASDADTVLIHDAARPCVSAELIDECYQAIIGHEGVMPCIPMKDTVYLCGNGQRVDSLLDRSRVFAGQAPELFLIGPYYEACQDLLPDQILTVNGSTEPAVLADMDVVMIPGDENNFKITNMHDMARFNDLVGNR